MGASDRRRRIARIGLIVVPVIALLAVVLSFTSGWWPSTAPTVPVSRPVADPAPSPDVPPSDGPTLVDVDGRPVPQAVVDGASRMYSALGSGDMAGIRAIYAPDDTAASWPVLQARISPAEVRTRLREALRQPPRPRPEVAYLYSAGDHGVGIAEDGRVAFVGTGQGAGSGTTTTTRATAARPSTVPFECEDSFEGDGLDLPQCEGAADASSCSSETTNCPSGYREGVVSRANPYGCDFNAISADNPCQWRMDPDPLDGTGRPVPATAAQRWAVCHLGGYREFC